MRCQGIGVLLVRLARTGAKNGPVRHTWLWQGMQVSEDGIPAVAVRSTV